MQTSRQHELTYNLLTLAFVLSIIFVFLASLQVNGKPYNQARLLLGGIGSLHPANRLAAYITGRLRVPNCISHVVPQKVGLSEKVKDVLRTEVAGKATVATPDTADLKASTRSAGINRHAHTHTLCLATVGHNQLHN